MAIAKISLGYVTASASLMADGLHSLSDCLSSVAGIIGVSIASRPRDVAHPYGHEKFETLASVAIGVILLLVALDLLYGATDRLFHPVTPAVTLVSFALLLISIAVSFALSRYESSVGKRIGSDILTSDASHMRSDVLVSLSVIASLLATHFGYRIADPIISAAIALLIGKVAVDIFKNGIDVLSDRAVLDPARVESLVCEAGSAIRCHNIRTRGRKDSVFIDLHISLPGDTNIAQEHAIEHRIEDRLKKNIPGVEDVFFHVEPRSK